MPQCNILTNHICVRLPGRYSPCCYWNKDYTQFADNPKKYFTTVDKSYTEYFNSELHQDVLQVMNTNGDWHAGCTKCKYLEDNGLPSLRTIGNEHSADHIVYLQISLSNHCNFACKTCDSRSSSTIMKMVNANPELSKWFNTSNITKADVYKMFQDVDLSKLKVIEFLGGEPFVDPQTTVFLNFLLSQDALSHVRFKVHTNSSFFPKKLVPILSKMKKIDLHLSVDAWHPAVEYIRLGSNFNTIKQVTNKWIEFSKEYKNTEITLFPTISSLSIPFVKSTVVAAKELGILHDVEFVHKPDQFQLGALPSKYVESIKDDYNSQYFNNYVYNEDYFKLLQAFVKDTDGAQSKFLKDYIPELDKYIKGE
jgi:organic radical activating enzyme